jgi:hypothetical protein
MVCHALRRILGAALLCAMTSLLSTSIAAAQVVLNPATLPSSERGAAYNQTITGSGGTGPYTFSLFSGALPPGISLSSGGVLSGHPTTLGTFNFTVQATDSVSNTGSQAYSVTISPATVTLSPASLPNGVRGVAYSQTITASGGTGSYTFSLMTGALPPGMALSASGAFSGTPSTTGTFNFTVQATDAFGNSGSQAYSVTISPATIMLSPASLPNGVRGVAYSQTITASGGTGSYTFSLMTGALPPGMALSASGAFSGTPSTTGTFNFTVQAMDAFGNTGSQAYSVTISPATITLSPASLPNGVRNVAYSQTITASGGTGPYTFSLLTGTLPPGMAFSSSGTFSGTPTTTGTFNFSIQATDAFGNTGSQAYSVTIDGSATTIALSSSANPSTVGQPVTFTTTVTSASGTPTGAVTFMDGGTTLGSATLAGGVAVFTTTALTIGTHGITASYSGSAIFAPSTSAVLMQAVNMSTDSARLRQMQIAATRLVAQASGQAISGAADSAIAEGFSEGGGVITPTANGVRFNFAADPDTRTARPANAGSPIDAALGLTPNTRPRIDDGFAALGHHRGKVAEPSLRVPSTEWLAWADVRGTGWSTAAAAGDIKGDQINALAGLTHKLSPDLLVGLLGGYETFDYSSTLLASRLKGDGWTVGGYVGWRIQPGLRFDASVARSRVNYDVSSGVAAAAIPGTRWLVSGGLTGSYTFSAFEIEPSARVYALWEREDAYVDTLGASEAARSFVTGRGSAGVKISYPWLVSSTLTVAPHVGLYGDYYFTGDNAAAVGLPLPATLIDGWSARLSSGLAIAVRDGARLSLGGELGGLGSGDFSMWSVRGRAMIPF